MAIYPLNCGLASRSSNFCWSSRPAINIWLALWASHRYLVVGGCPWFVVTYSQTLMSVPCLMQEVFFLAAVKAICDAGRQRWFPLPRTTSISMNISCYGNETICCYGNIFQKSFNHTYNSDLYSWYTSIWRYAIIFQSKKDNFQISLTIKLKINFNIWKCDHLLLWK